MSQPQIPIPTMSFTNWTYVDPEDATRKLKFTGGSLFAGFEINEGTSNPRSVVFDRAMIAQIRDDLTNWLNNY